jgi:PilZ domain
MRRGHSSPSSLHAIGHTPNTAPTLKMQDLIQVSVGWTRVSISIWFKGSLISHNVAPMTRTERRLAERFDLKIPLRVRIAKPAALDHTAESLNISTRGIYFATDLPLSKGTPVHLVFQMPEEVAHKPASEWRCTGHVVHVQPASSQHGATCAGVRFDCYEVLPTVRTSVKPTLPIG